MITFDSEIAIDLSGGHVDDVLAFEVARAHLGLARQRATAHEHLVGRVDLVAALEQDVVVGRVGDEYAVIGLVRLDAQENGRAQYDVARVREALITVDALVRRLIILML